MIAGDVMDRAAVLYNDAAKSIVTYAVQIPYVNVALDELQETMELNNVPMTNEVSSILAVTVGITDIGGSTGPALPADLIEIQGAYERMTGSNEDFQIMSKVEFLPPFVVTVEALIYWAWTDQTIQFLGATTNRDVRLNYIGAVLAPITASSTPITLFNAKSFLAYRTAALLSEFVGENKTRADELNSFAGAALDRFLGINTKGRQSIATRRRPFMSSYKVRSGF